MSGKNYFPNRVEDAWNGLLEHALHVKSVESFEGRLHWFLSNQEFVCDYRANEKDAGTGSQIPAADYIDLVKET